MRKKIFMDLMAPKRRKMSKMNEPTQTSPKTQNIDDIIAETGVSLYEEHYNSPYYVDKTLLIEQLVKESRILITVPSRFGKSLNMNMAKKFFEIELDEQKQPIELKFNKKTKILEDIQPNSNNFKLFEKKNIFKNKKLMTEHFGKYPVIHVNFRPVKGNTFEEILSLLGDSIHTAFEEHDYLIESSLWKNPKCEKEIFMRYFSTKNADSLTPKQIKKGLPILAKYLYYYYGKKVFVLIDEFDVPVNMMLYKNRMSHDDRQIIIEFMQELIAIILKDSEMYVKRSLCNGCQQVGGILSDGANNIRHCPFMKPHVFAEFYGFSLTEITDLLQRVKKSELFDEIKNHYNGYQAKFEDGRVIAICSPWAVIQYVKTGELSNHWSAGIPEKICHAMGCSEIRQKIMEILRGKHVPIQYKEKLEIKDIDSLCDIMNVEKIDNMDVDIFMQFLYEYGFFYPVVFNEDRLILALPNEGVHAEIDRILSSIDAVTRYYNHQPKLINGYIASLENLAESCEESRVRELAKSIATLFEKSTIKPDNEFDFHAPLFAYVTKKFAHTRGECRTIENKICDMVTVITKHNAVFAIEVKLKESAEKAYNQLVDRKYYTLSNKSSLEKLFPTVTESIKKRIFLGINMDEKCKVTITYSFDEIVKNQELLKTVSSEDP